MYSQQRNNRRYDTLFEKVYMHIENSMTMTIIIHVHCTHHTQFAHRHSAHNTDKNQSKIQIKRNEIKTSKKKRAKEGNREQEHENESEKKNNTKKKKELHMKLRKSKERKAKENDQMKMNFKQNSKRELSITTQPKKIDLQFRKMM